MSIFITSQGVDYVPTRAQLQKLGQTQQAKVASNLFPIPPIKITARKSIPQRLLKAIYETDPQFGEFINAHPILFNLLDAAVSKEQKSKILVQFLETTMVDQPTVNKLYSIINDVKWGPLMGSKFLFDAESANTLDKANDVLGRDVYGDLAHKGLFYNRANELLPQTLTGEDIVKLRNAGLSQQQITNLFINALPDTNPQVIDQEVAKLFASDITQTVPIEGIGGPPTFAQGTQTAVDSSAQTDAPVTSSVENPLVSVPSDPIDTGPSAPPQSTREQTVLENLIAAINSLKDTITSASLPRATSTEAPPVVVDSATSTEAPPVVDSATSTEAPPVVDSATSTEAPPVVDSATSTEVPPVMDGSAQTVEGPSLDEEMLEDIPGLDVQIPRKPLEPLKLTTIAELEEPKEIKPLPTLVNYNTMSTDDLRERIREITMKWYRRTETGRLILEKTYDPETRREREYDLKLRTILKHILDSRPVQPTVPRNDLIREGVLPGAATEARGDDVITEVPVRVRPTVPRNDLIFEGVLPGAAAEARGDDVITEVPVRVRPTVPRNDLIREGVLPGAAAEARDDVIVEKDDPIEEVGPKGSAAEQYSPQRETEPAELNEPRLRVESFAARERRLEGHRKALEEAEADIEGLEKLKASGKLTEEQKKRLVNAKSQRKRSKTAIEGKGLSVVGGLLDKSRFEYGVRNLDDYDSDELDAKVNGMKTKSGKELMNDLYSYHKFPKNITTTNFGRHFSITNMPKVLEDFVRSNGDDLKDFDGDLKQLRKYLSDNRRIK